GGVSAARAPVGRAAEANSTVKVFQDGTLVSTLPTNATGAWSYKPTVTDGFAHYFTATATNAAGKTSPASAEVIVTVDTLVNPTLGFSHGTLSGTSIP